MHPQICCRSPWSVKSCWAYQDCLDTFLIADVNFLSFSSACVLHFNSEWDVPFLMRPKQRILTARVLALLSLRLCDPERSSKDFLQLLPRGQCAYLSSIFQTCHTILLQESLSVFAGSGLTCQHSVPLFLWVLAQEFQFFFHGMYFNLILMDL